MENMLTAMISQTEKELLILKTGLFCQLCKKFVVSMFFQCGHAVCDRCGSISKKCFVCFQDIVAVNKLNNLEAFSAGL